MTIILANSTASGGHAQNDTLSGDNFRNLIGSAHDDTLRGTGHANIIWGGAGNDTLDGRNGDDTLHGGLGADNLIGGNGNDTASYTESGAGVTISLEDATASGGDAQGDLRSGIENVTGSAHADVLTGDSNANVLTAGAGDDTVEGRGGGDTLWGEKGIDTLSYANSGAFVTVNLSNSTVSGGHATGDTIGGFENVIGSAHGDTITGDRNANVIEGGAGGDTLDGGTGADMASYAGSSAAVTVNLSNNTASGGHAQGDSLSNIEHLIGSAHDDTLTGDGTTILEGRAGADTLNGGLEGGVYRSTASYAGSDAGVSVNLKTGAASGGHAQGDTLSNIRHLVGSGHDDTLTGDSNNNEFIGGPGNDTLDGGTGTGTNEDLFYFFSGFGNDTINGYATSNEIRVCIEDAAVVPDRTSARTVLTVADSSGNQQGTITVAGNWGSDALDVTTHGPDENDCIPTNLLALSLPHYECGGQGTVLCNLGSRPVKLPPIGYSYGSVRTVRLAPCAGLPASAGKAMIRPASTVLPIRWFR